MQRYRVNLPLLIGLVVGAIVLAGGSYGLYTFQKSRNASRLLEREQAARDAGDLDEAKDLLVNYLRIRPGEQEAMVRLSNVLAEIAEQPRSEPRDIRVAMGQMEATVREFPDEVELRRRLVDLYMSRRVRLLKPALDHVSQLLNRTPKDPELEGLLSQCYFASASPKATQHAYTLIGFDPDTEKFDLDGAIAPGDVGVYARLAQNLRIDQREPELAEQVVNQMVEANPESGEAYLARGQFFEQLDRDDEAVVDIQKALELSPEDPSIITANARLAAREERYEDAETLLREGIETSPNEPILFQTLADVKVRRGEYDEALAICDEGVAAVPVEQSTMLLVQKARLQLQSEDPSTAANTIKFMRESEIMQAAYPDYLEARLWMTEGKWFEAAKVFDEYASTFARSQSLGVELNVMLGLCREKLGENELALEAFDRAARLDPENSMADLGRQRLRTKLGGGNRRGESRSIYTLLSLELAKPPAQQDWRAFDDECERYIERMQLGEGMLKVLRGEVFMRRKMYPEARKELIDSYKLDPNNLGVRRAAVKLFAADPDQGPVKALKLLDKVVEDFGDMPILRLERADLLSVINDEDLTNQLFALTEGIDQWETKDKVQLWKGLADKFARLRDEESRAECLRQVTILAPGDLPSLLETFRVARTAGDAAAMKEVQDQILEVVGSRDDANWLYTEALRVITEWRASGSQGDGLERADELVDRALGQRAKWHELHNLKAVIALARNDVQSALAWYDRGADLGRQNARSLYQYIKLLMSRARYSDALARMEGIGRDGRLRLLGQDYALCLLRLGRTGESVEIAREYSLQAPNSGAMQLWLGRFLSQASGATKDGAAKAELTAEAGEAFRAAVEADRGSSEAWLALVGFYAATGDPVKADDTIRDAQLALVEDQSQLLFARCYEMVGRGMDAEALYKEALETATDADLARVSRLAAQFYLGPAYRGDDRAAKATPLINRVLKSVADGDIQANNPHAQWSRSAAARLLAAKGTYQELRDAERLLASNVTNGALPVADRQLMAEILAPRPEPVSRMKAAGLLEEIGRNQQLSKKSELDLAKLYFALGDWRKCREKMLDLIGAYSDDTNVRLAYIEMLLQRGGPTEIDLAVRQVKRLQEIAPKALSTREMLARIAFEKGKKNEASKTLLSLLPRKVDAIKAEQTPLLMRVAVRLTGFEDYDRARKVYELAAKVGGPRERLALAQFIGEHVDGPKGLNALEALRGDVPDEQIIQRGMAVLRAIDGRGDEISEAMFEQFEGWLERSLREDPDLIALRLQESELLDLKRNYDAAAQAYRALLDRSDLTGVARAVVLNNLAYLLALADKEKEAISEAAGYTAEAVDILGPGSEILDTRAVIAIADGRYDDAIEDLKLAVIDRPTASKYFHLAAAYAGAGDKQQAASAWEQALEKGLTRESVNRLEREQFDQLQKQVESGGLTSVVR